MKFAQLLHGVFGDATHDVVRHMPAGMAADVDADVDITSITVDSRRVRAGTLFVAAAGATPNSRDGHDFIDAAVAAGAVAVVAGRPCPTVDVPVIVVDDPRRVGALAAEVLAGSPSQRLKLCGVTGTNGKTTVTTLLAHIATAAGRKGGVIGTLGVGLPDQPRTTGFTTPEAEDLSHGLHDLVDDGFAVVGMEVSSHALATRRADGVTFAAVAFTNLTHDHLDFHGTVASYLQAKVRLFSELRGDAVAIIPAGLGAVDQEALAALRTAAPDAWTWGIDTHQATIAATDVRADARGLRFTLTFSPPGTISQSAEVSVPHLLGRFNVENAVVAAGLALAAGIALVDVVQGLGVARPPRGRMERVDTAGVDDAPVIVVDYAHTPDALERALLCARGFTAGRLIVVFGCGGDRDATKRPVMGKVATDVADVVIITDDNPRSEDADAIVAAIASGIGASKQEVGDARNLLPGHWLRQRNRRLAIGAALSVAGEGDVVVIAGKGHEVEQLHGDTHLPFDDVREARALVRRLPRPAFLDRTFVEAVLGNISVPVSATTFLGVCTDSRAIEPGTLFIALVGDTFDGHGYVEAALQAGAAAAVVNANATIAGRYHDLPLFVVDDTLMALQQLAGAWLSRQPAHRIGLTGSNGKTTTKELLAACLRNAVGDDGVQATFGNLNNHIGVPLTALTVEPHHRYVVLEMGMNHLGEIASYCALTQPQLGLVTNMGTAHAGNVGGVEGVANAKAELFLSLPSSGIAIVNADDPRCVREAQEKARCRQLYFGTALFADVRLEDVVDLETGGQRLTIRHAGNVAEVSIPMDGRHNALNATGAVAAAVALGVDLDTAVSGLSAVHAAHGRLERCRRADGLLLLDDSYNANPDSMEAGLETLRQVSGGRPTVAVLGEMLELGPQAMAAHRHIGAAAAQSGIDALFCCGAFADAYADGARGAGLEVIVTATTSTLLAPLVRAAVTPQMVVLIKGSRGARMERVVEVLLKRSDLASAGEP